MRISDPKNLRVQANVKFYKDSLKDKNETETNEALPELVNNQTILAKSRHQYDSLCQGNVNTVIIVIIATVQCISSQLNPGTEENCPYALLL